MYWSPCCAARSRCDELAMLGTVHTELMDSLRLAVSIFLNGDARQAERLLARKGAFRALEAQCTALHVRLLRSAAISYRGDDMDKLNMVAEETGWFLRIVDDLRRIHSHIAAIAYTVLPPAHAADAPLDVVGNGAISE